MLQLKNNRLNTNDAQLITIAVEQVAKAENAAIFVFSHDFASKAMIAYRNCLGSTCNGSDQQRKWLRMVTLARATPVATLALQSNGAITPQLLAIINGVPDGATLPAGKRVKTVGYR